MNFSSLTRPGVVFSRVAISAAALLMPLAGCKKKEVPVEKPPRPVNIHVEAQIFRLPRSVAFTMVLNQPKNTDYTAVLKQVQALVAEKKATLIATPSLSTVSGNRAVVESITEFRYGTEFQAPQIPQSFGGNASPKATTTTTKTTTTSVTVETKGTFPVTPTTPTAFETRNLGITLECEPVYDKEFDTISFQIAPQIVALQQMIKYATENGGVIEQPIFYTQKITTNLTIKNGGTAFLGTTEPDKTLNKDEDMTDVVFFRAATW